MRRSLDVVSDLGITVYGCGPDEAALFAELSPGFGIVPTVTGAPLTESTVVSVPANRCVSVGHKSEVGEPLLAALHDVGVEHLSTRSIGFDHIDLEAAERLGITVENAVYAPDGVADFTVMLILMAIRNAKHVTRATDRHDFRLAEVRGRDLRDLTVGVVGVGHIGSAVIARLVGFGCRVLAHSRHHHAVAATFVPLDALLRESDVVTLHLPLDAETYHFMGCDELEAMKPGAILVNTGRGALVDTAALLHLLEHGRLGGVALDVLEGEDGIFYCDRSTTPVDHPALLRLQALPNAIVTPHTAYYTDRALRDTVETTLANVLRFERTRTSEEAHRRRVVRRNVGGA